MRARPAEGKRGERPREPGERAACTRRPPRRRHTIARAASTKHDEVREEERPRRATSRRDTRAEFFVRPLARAWIAVAPSPAKNSRAASGNFRA